MTAYNEEEQESFKRNAGDGELCERSRMISTIEKLNNSLRISRDLAKDMAELYIENLNNKIKYRMLAKQLARIEPMDVGSNKYIRTLKSFGLEYKKD
uniref:Uncharacterized protein n=1 Tax=uncultured marine virus TaxID=186617 RepID=A0A0F7L656_9VIRU|nr:hypothetical protein [uncultured marine virus]